jgi:GT2 family glycosyltransferase
MNTDYYVVIPNWNGLDFIEKCLESLRAQTVRHHVIVVDNGSSDGSNRLVREKFPEVELLEFPNNAGFAGGVNRGIRPALEGGARYVVLLNNDAVAEPTWLERLVAAADANPRVGAVAAKILKEDGHELDSTGDLYSVWGLPFPRGRDEADSGQYDGAEARGIFAASGGASLYRAEMLKEIGLFDERFFAYYEDSDIGFRGQLAGWKVLYEPAARVYHYVGGTSSRIDLKGEAEAAAIHHQDKPSAFARYHSVKNIIFLYTKNMPGWLYWKYLPLFWASLVLLLVNDAGRGLLGSYFKGLGSALRQMPGVLADRRRIQRGRKVSIGYVDSILYHKLPPIQKMKVAKVKQKLGL